MATANELTVTLPRPHVAQLKVLRAARRFNVVVCGRRWGKTQLGIFLACHTALEGYPVSWFAPIYKDSAEVWRDFKRYLSDVIVDKNEQERRLELITGGSIEVWTLTDPDSGRGRKNKRVIVDEAAKIKQLEIAWTQTIRPTLTDYQGDAWFLSTPKGRNYFWRLHQLGNTEPDWASFQMPTSENPFLPEGEVEDARRNIPQSAFEQEYMARFTDDAGAVFRHVRECIDPTIPSKPQPGRRYVGGLDWAQVNDFTVIAVVDDTGALVALDRFNQVSWSIQYGRVKAITESWKLSSGLAEINSIGSPNFEQLQKEGLRQWNAFMTTADSKSDIIQELALAFERKEIRIPNDPVLIAELEAFEATRLPSGKWRYAAPSGGHDDTVMALALAWHGRKSRTIEFKSNPFFGG